MTPAGFPHSDISGSTSARDSPKLFAACHVLRRLLAPRHPPDALLLLKTHRVHTRQASHRTHPTVRGQNSDARRQRLAPPTQHQAQPIGSDPIHTYTHFSPPNAHDGPPRN